MTHKRRPRILLMDDSPLFLDVANHALLAAGYDVYTARTLAELERAEDGPAVDLVLMDVQMPEIFGDDIAMVMRQVRGVEAPIYLLSSLDEESLAERASEAGIEGYISKHAGVDHLLERVHSILAAGGAPS